MFSEPDIELDLTSNLVLSAIIRWNPIPTPSMTARKTPHIMAEFRAALYPPLIAKAPPVQNPAMTEKGFTVRYCVSSSMRQTRRTGIIRIFLLPDSLNCAIKSRKQPAPDAEVTSEDRRARLNCCESAYPSFAVGAVSEPFDTVPDGAANSLSSWNLVSRDSREICPKVNRIGRRTPIQKAPPKSDKATLQQLESVK